MVVPFPPVRRINVDPVLGNGVHPPAENAPARENKCVLAVIVDDSEFEIAVERRACDWVPVHLKVSSRTKSAAALI